MKLHQDLCRMYLCWLVKVKEEHPFLLLIALQIAVATKWRKIRAPTLDRWLPEVYSGRGKND